MILPMITGIWIMVARVKPSGMYPKNGTTAIRTIIATKSDNWTNSLVVRVFIFDFPPAIVPVKPDTMLNRDYFAVKKISFQVFFSQKDIL